MNNMALISKKILFNQISKKEMWKRAKRQYSMCDKKQVYSKKDAQTIRNLRMKHGSGELRIYHCPICNGWHLTSQI